MKKILFIGIFLLTLLSVFATPTIYGSSQDVFMNSCTVYSESFTLTNSDFQGHPYALSVDSSISSWVTFSEENIFIGPGGSKEITLFIRPPCGESGTFNLPILIESDVDSVNYERDIIVQNAPNLRAHFDNTQLESCPCNGQLIPFSVSNIGPYAESYSISVSNHKDNIVVNPSNMYIGPGLSRSGSIFVSFACDTYGENDFDVIITADNSGYEASVPITYTINACSEFTLQAQPSVDICQYQEKNISVSLTNNAAYANSYSFNSHGSFTQGDYDITLGSKQSVEIPVTLAPEKNTLGVHTSQITVKELFANYNAQQDIQVEVLDCYDISLETEVSEVPICHEEQTVLFDVVNGGIFDEEIHVNLDGPSYVQLNESVFTLENGTQKQIPLIIDGKQINSSQKGEFTLTVVQASAPKVYDEVTVRFVKDSFSECYGLELVEDVFSLNDSTTNISIGITSIGTRDKTYTLGFNASEWMSVPLSQINISAGQTSFIPVNISLNESILNGSYEVFLVAETENYVQILPVLVHYNTESRWMLYVLFFVLFLLLLALLLLALLVFGTNNNNKRNSHNVTTKKSISSDSQKEKKTDEKQKKRFWLFLLLGLFLVLLLFILIASVMYVSQSTTQYQEVNETNTTFTEPEVVQPDQIESEQTQTINDTQEDESSNDGGFFAWLASLFSRSEDDTVSVGDSADNTTVDNTITNTTNTNDTNTNDTITVDTNTTEGEVNDTVDTQPENMTDTEVDESVTEDSQESLWSRFTQWVGMLFSSSSDTNQTNETMTDQPVAQNQTGNNSVTIDSNETFVNETSDNESQIVDEQNQTVVPTAREIALQQISEYIQDNNITGDSQTVFFIDENSSRIVDLDDFFVDPDGDNLTFTVYEKNASQVTVRLNGSLVKITPAPDYVGITQTYFTATDSQDVGVVSPELTLIIRPIEQENEFVTYSVLIILFIIVFLIVIYFDIRIMQSQMKKSQSKKAKKNAQKNAKKNTRKKAKK